MKITKILPLGWCEGVASAFINLKKIKSIYPNKKIYMIGWLVHNENVVQDISKMGIEVLDVSSKNRYSTLKKIKNKSECVVVFSAHGTNPEIIEYAEKNFFKVHDLTCKYVAEQMIKVTNQLEFVDQVIFLGTRKHPEAEAFKSLSSKVKIIENSDEIKKYKRYKNEKIFATTQTTVQMKDADSFREKIIDNFQNSKYINGSCMATRLRQENLLLSLKKIDVLVVVGDKKSNNTKSLVEIAKNNNLPVHWISSWKEIITSDFKKYKNCGLCSGASTPLLIVNEIFEILSQI